MKTRSSRALYDSSNIHPRYARKRIRSNSTFPRLLLVDNHHALSMSPMEMTEENMAAIMANSITPSLTSIKAAAATAAAAPASQLQLQTPAFRLLDLPLEILMLIIEYALPIPHDSDSEKYVTISNTCHCPSLNRLHREGQDCYHPSPPSPSLSLLRTNRTLYHLSRAHLYANTTLHITDKPRSRSSLPDPSCPAAAILARQGATHIHYLLLTLDLWLFLDPTWLHARLLLLKSQFPRLQSLTFELLPGSEPPSRATACLQVLADPELRRICREVTVCMCLGRNEHRWTFQTDVGVREQPEAKIMARRIASAMAANVEETTEGEDTGTESGDSSYRSFCVKKGHAQRELLRKRLEFLPTWLLLLAETEALEQKKKNGVKIVREEEVDSVAIAKAMELLEPVHSMQTRKDWWWW